MAVSPSASLAPSPPKTAAPSLCTLLNDTINNGGPVIPRGRVSCQFIHSGFVSVTSAVSLGEDVQGFSAGIGGVVISPPPCRFVDLLESACQGAKPPGWGGGKAQCAGFTENPSLWTRL